MTHHSSFLPSGCILPVSGSLLNLLGILFSLSSSADTPFGADLFILLIMQCFATALKTFCRWSVRLVGCIKPLTG